MLVVQEFVSADCGVPGVFVRARDGDSFSVIVTGSPDGAWDFFEDNTTLNAYAPFLPLTANDTRTLIERLARKGCHRALVGTDAVKHLVAIVGFRRPGAVQQPPAECSNCGTANEWGAVTGADNTFTCYSCRQDPHGRRIR